MDLTIGAFYGLFVVGFGIPFAFCWVIDQLLSLFMPSDEGEKVITIYYQ